jgi:hypothetical protein
MDRKKNQENLWDVYTKVSRIFQKWQHDNDVCSLGKTTTGINSLRLESLSSYNKLLLHLIMCGDSRKESYFEFGG